MICHSLKRTPWGKKIKDCTNTFLSSHYDDLGETTEHILNKFKKVKHKWGNTSGELLNEKQLQSPPCRFVLLWQLQ
jgi:hypothetical protein